jgi:hypothetical protein
MTITKNELIERIEKEKILELPIKDLEDAFNAEFNSKLISIIEDTAIDPLFTKSYSYFDEEDEEEENYGFIKVIYWDKNKVVLCFSTYFSIIAFSNRIILSDLMKILRYLKEGQNILFRVSLTERRIKFQSELVVPVVYKGLELDAELRCDLFIENILHVELKSVSKILLIY